MILVRCTSDRASRRLQQTLDCPLVPWFANHTSDVFHRINDWYANEALAVKGVLRAEGDYPLRRADVRAVL